MACCVVEEIIDVEWSNRKLHRATRKDRDGQRLLGERWAPFKRRLRTLEVADCLEDVLPAPGGFHPLTADKTGEWAAALSRNWRLVFEPADEPVPTLNDGGLDARNVRRVRILRVEDYHGR
jgi:proteic killer suppression protein